MAKFHEFEHVENKLNKVNDDILGTRKELVELEEELHDSFGQLDNMQFSTINFYIGQTKIKLKKLRSSRRRLENKFEKLI